MKGLILLLTLTIGILRAPAQHKLIVHLNQDPLLTAHAGNDQNLVQGVILVLGDVMSASGGSGIYTYSWQPADFLDDPSAPNPQALPESSISYVLTVTDMTCFATDTIDVNIITDVDSLLPIQLFEVFPNPNPGMVQVKIVSRYSLDRYVLNVMDPSGREIYSRTLGAIYELEESLHLRMTRGTYIFSLTGASNKYFKKVIFK